MVYGLGLVDLERLPKDLDGVNWFEQGQTAYQADLAFLKQERGFLDHLSAGFTVCAPNGIQGKPNGPREEPILRTDATLFTVAGGLPYFGQDVTANNLAQTLSALVNQKEALFDWHGWPCPTVDATNAAHEVVCRRIVGQDVSFTGLAIDNYLTHRAQNLVLQNGDLRRVLNQLFPPQIASTHHRLLGGNDMLCRGVPFTGFSVEGSDTQVQGWQRVAESTFKVDGTAQVRLSGKAVRRFYRVASRPEANIAMARSVALR